MDVHNMRSLLTHNLRGTILSVACFAFLFFFAAVPLAFAQENPVVGFLGGAFDGIAKLIYNVFLIIGGIIAGAGAQVLDIAISLTIINMGLVFEQGIGMGVQALWVIIRDILNILFIFGLIFIGIKTILNSEDSNTRRALGLLIVSALLINFSLFITLTIIDFTNVAAVQMYNQITNQGAGSVDVSPDAGGHAGLTWVFVDVANLSSLFGGEDALDNMDAIKIIGYSIFMLFFLLFAGIVFFMGAFLVMSRFVALVIYTIISPAMFLGWILPSLQDHSRKWWRGFIKQAFFAPAFLFMLYMSLVVLQRMKTYLTTNTDLIGSNAGYANMLEGGGMFSQQMGLIFMFCMTIGFLYASMKVGQMMSVAGANTTMKMTDNARRGLQGFAYRNTVGLGVKAGSKGLLRGMDALEQRMAKGEESSATQSYVRRATSNLGRGIANATITSAAARRSLETARDYRGGGRSKSDVEKEEKEQAERIAGNAKQIKLSDAIKAKLNTADPKSEAGMAASIALESALSDASASDLAKLAGTKEGLEQLTKVVGSIPEKKFESLMDNKDLSPEDKNKLGAGRAAAIEKNLMRDGKSLQQGISGASADELNALEFTKLMDNAIYIQSGQIEKLGSKWGEEKMRIFKEKRKQDLEKKFSEGAKGIEEVLTTRGGEKEIGKLPNELFTKHQKAFLDYTLSKDAKVKLTGGLMQHIATESGITGSDKKALGAAIVAAQGDAMSDDLKNFFRSPAGGAFGVNIDAVRKQGGSSTMDQSV